MDAVTNVPPPVNEPVMQYVPGSPERAAVEAKIKDLAGEQAELTMAIGGMRRMGGGAAIDVVQPHNHRHVLGRMGEATDDDMVTAIDAAHAAAPAWQALSFEDRAAIFLKAAELLSGPWRATMNAATILGQSKSVYQAEIDAACELIDFWRFNVAFARQLLAEQPLSSAGAWNRLEYRPLDGFVLAITPFNFTSIAGNLPSAPTLFGNTVVWKPSSTQQLSAQVIIDVLEAAGLPPGVINMVTGRGEAVSRVALTHPRLAGIHFTGSTALIRGAYEYQGQKCSAASRSYIPRSLWDRMGDSFVSLAESLTMGDVASDLSLYMGAVINAGAIAEATSALRFAAGNFYINDKPTGAVVGQQPFGGSRASGTNDKAGSVLNLTRWVSARAIKEVFSPPVDYRYPHMG